MSKKIINIIAKLDRFVLKNRMVSAALLAMQQTLPLLVICVYAQLISQLILSPNALFVTLFNWRLRIPVTFQLQEILSLLEVFVLMILAATFTKQYLSIRKVTNTVLPTLTNFLGTYFLFLGKGQTPTYDTSQYLLVLMLSFISCESFYFYQKFISRDNPQPFAIRFLIWAGFVLLIDVSLHFAIQRSVVRSMLSTLLSNNFFTTFIGLVIVSIVAPLLWWLGIGLPHELINNPSTINAVIKNLDTILTNTNATLPYPTNLYSVYTAFSLFGGVGSTLAISFILLFSVRKKRQHLGMLSLLPSLFNSNQLLYFGLPIFLRPLLLVPMIMTSLLGTLIGYTVIVTHLIKPATLSTPNTMPSSLIGFLGSNDNWSLFITTIIFALSVIIYRPFIAIETSEVSYEK
ncbi:PTS transporter subunit EIIC [Leuconostoc falkenbergense]|uniref:PTS transporter subunit EIIC n=1 Tax=Leuconostoc falkenbergense TaxID=2766470 RepID=UPI0024A9DEAC|nr:PTS transporter subunit EIIC [Leuconostoc falkenbergense]MDI6553734.1 PTS sugar transporter subunit IIC [Leuconostoc falkenbergense]